MRINFPKRFHWSLIAVILLATILRIINLSNVPPHLTPDEAAIGYNAYSILKTGRDEYGEFMPIIFKSFGDYKPGLYIYLTTPIIATAGISEFSVRLPSALSGILAVYLLYQICKLFIKHFEIDTHVYIKRFPIFSAFLLAINPWHIHFSRGGWEISVSLTLTLMGIYFFLKSLENSKYIIASACFFSLTLLTYQGAKLSTLIVIVILFSTFFQHCKTLFLKKGKLLSIAIASGFIIALPILLSFSQGQTGRLKVFSVFSNPRPENYLQHFLDQGAEKVGTISYIFFHTEGNNFARGIIGRWFNHYSGRFLFFEGDWQNLKHSIPYHGVLTLGDIALLLTGVFFLLRNLKYKPFLFFALWFLLASLPAALSRDEIHAVRSFNMVIPLTCILSLGVIWISDISKKLSRSMQRVCLTLLIICYSISYLYFLDMYFIHIPKHNARAWDYGIKQVVQTIVPIQNNFHKIKVQQSFAQPYIYFLFFGAQMNPELYDPAVYQKNALLLPSNVKDDVGLVHNLMNIEFTAINWPENRGESGVLFAGDEVRIPPTDSMDPNLFVIHNDIFYPDGRRAFRVVEVK